MLFFPPPRYVQRISCRNGISIRKLCELTGVECRASGEWTNRTVVLIKGAEVLIEAEPGSWGSVRITVPRSRWNERYELALQVLAYALHDLVARESIRGSLFNILRPPRGRPRRRAPMSNRERQRLFRRRHEQTKQKSAQQC